MEPRKLFRNAAAGRLAGVCAGIADYLDVDVTVVRLGWIILSIVPGGLVGGVIAYVAAALVMPVAPPSAEEPRTKRRVTRSSTDRKIAGVCGGLADFFSIDPTVVRLLWIVLTIVPGAIILGMVAYAVAWFIIPEAPRQALTQAPTAA